MPVIVEGFTVLIDRLIVESSPGKFASLLANRPNDSFCGDGWIIRAAFAELPLAYEYLQSLADLQNGRGKPCASLAIQSQGIITECDWAILENKELFGEQGRTVVTVARHMYGDGCFQRGLQRVGGAMQELEWGPFGPSGVELLSLSDKTTAVAPAGWDPSLSIAASTFRFDARQLEEFFVRLGTSATKPHYRPIDSMDINPRHTKPRRRLRVNQAVLLQASQRNLKRQEKACRALAQMFNEMKLERLTPWLHEKVRLVVQETGEMANGIVAVQAFFSRWFVSMSLDHARFWAELGWADTFNAGPVVVLSVETKKNPSYVVLFHMTWGKIVGITLCVEPGPGDCRRLGVYPVATRLEVLSNMVSRAFSRWGMKEV